MLLAEWEWRIGEENDLAAAPNGLTVAVTDNSMAETFDHQHRRYHFVVQPNPALPDRFGIMYIPGEWAVPAHTPASVPV